MESVSAALTAITLFTLYGLGMLVLYVAVFKLAVELAHWLWQQINQEWSKHDQYQRSSQRARR